MYQDLLRSLDLKSARKAKWKNDKRVLSYIRGASKAGEIFQAGIPCAAYIRTRLSHTTP